MIPVILVLALLSLLVATDPEPNDSSAPPSPEPPRQPDRKPAAQAPAAAERLAA